MKRIFRYKGNSYEKGNKLLLEEINKWVKKSNPKIIYCKEDKSLNIKDNGDINIIITMMFVTGEKNDGITKSSLG